MRIYLYFIVLTLISIIIFFMDKISFEIHWLTQVIIWVGFLIYIKLEELK